MMIHNRSPQQPERRPIVVGVDGSPGSKAALRWSLNQAEQTTVTVEAVIVWAPEATFYGYEWASVAGAVDDLAAAAEIVLIDTLVEKPGVLASSAYADKAAPHPAEGTTL